MKQISFADFELDEYQRRVARAQEEMRAANIDALIITDPANLRYLMGFHNLLQLSVGRSFVGLFVRDDPDASALFIPHDCQDAPQTWVEDVQFWDEGVEPPFDDLVVDMGKVSRKITRAFSNIPSIRKWLRARRLGLRSARIGIDIGDGMRLGLPMRQFEELRHLLYGDKLVDAGPLIWNLRKVKSKAEVAVMEKCCRISLQTMDEASMTLREGMTERELCLWMHSRLFALGCDGQGFLSIQFGADGWRRANMAPTDQVALAENQWVYIDGGGILMGYNSDYARTVLFGSATDRQKRLKAACGEANQAMFEATRPGARCSDLYRAAYRVIEQHGVTDAVGSTSFGHGVGLNIHEAPNLGRDNDEPLIEGMVLSIEPWLLDKSPDGGLFNTEDVVVVTSNGARRLAKD